MMRMRRTDLLNTVVKSFSEGNVVIKEENISVCHTDRQGPKVNGKQPILVKFVSRSNNNKKKTNRQRSP